MELGRGAGQKGGTPGDAEQRGQLQRPASSLRGEPRAPHIPLFQEASLYFRAERFWIREMKKT